MTTYRIVRFYRDNPDANGQIVETGLTLDEAHAHCNNPETSSATTTSAVGQARTRYHGPWFDGFESEDET
jgi:hypothetical protein